MSVLNVLLGSKFKLPVEASFVGSDSSSSALTTYSFASVALGDAFTDRYILVAIAPGGAANRSISSVTIAGISATVHVQGTYAVGGDTSEPQMGWAGAFVPSGTTGTISVTFSGSKSTCSISVYSVANSTGTVVSTGESVGGTRNLTSRTLSLDLNASGITLLGLCHTDTMTETYNISTTSLSFAWFLITRSPVKFSIILLVAS